jgi:hypothetical protein
MDADRFWNRIDRTGPCWLWTGGLASNGYGQVWRDGKNGRAHRIAWELTHGPIPPGLHVCHTCDVRHCARPDHLFLGTCADNMADRDGKGRGARRNKPALVIDVEAVRSRHAAGESQRSIGRSLGVSQSSISHIVNRAHRYATI